MRLLFVAMVSAGVVSSQAPLPPPRLRFEVASVKPTTNPDGRALVQAVPGRLIMTNLALRRLILIAYGVQDYQLMGDPSWVSSAHYEIEAKADGNATVQQMEGPMLQVFLEERFRLIIHRETRQLPVYELTIGKGGAKLQPSKEGSCAPYAVDSPPLPALNPSTPRPNYCGFHPTMDGPNRVLDGKAVTMTELATNLSRTYNSSLGRNVIDRTGLAGTFDVNLRWAIDPLNAVADPDIAPPFIFAALQEQLGLKLESAKGAVEILVIDRVEKPSAN